MDIYVLVLLVAFAAMIIIPFAQQLVAAKARSLNAISAIATVLLALATTYLAYMGGGQLHEMHQASDIEKQTLELSQRAYVFFDEAHFIDNVFTKFIENSGNTATKHLLASVKCTTVDGRTSGGDPFGLFKWDAADMSPNILAARQKKPIPAVDPKVCELNQDILAKIGSGDSRRYMAGEATYYESVHPTCRRITQFAEEIVINSGIISALPRGQHNCADERLSRGTQMPQRLGIFQNRCTTFLTMHPASGRPLAAMS
jgi:hypothetical protein